MPRGGPEIVPCPPARRGEALALFLGGEPVAGLAETLGESPTDPRLLIALRAGRLEGVVLLQRLAGLGGAVWPPRVRPGWGRAELAGRLVGAAVEGLRAEGARVVQSLVGPGGPRTALADLNRGGLPHVTDLLTLGRLTEPPLDPRPGTPALVWSAFADEPRHAFDAALAATYEGSRDMPELEGLRRLDDLISGQRAAGRFDPALWLLGRLPGEPDAAAVLLLADVPERELVEVVYLGLTPPARGRGLGRATLAQALDRARPLRALLELAVDVRNGPALRLYRDAGFRNLERRAVHLRVLEGP